MVEEPKRRGVLLGLVCKNREGLVGNVNFEDSLGCSGYEIVEFGILHGRNKVISRILTLSVGEPALRYTDTLRCPMGNNTER